MRRAVGVLTLGVVGLASGFFGHQLNEHPRVQAVVTKAALEIDKEGTRYLRRFGFSCGVEAWSVKTLTDSNASSVNLAPARTVIPSLLGRAGTPGDRTTPAQVFSLVGTHRSEERRVGKGCRSRLAL